MPKHILTLPSDSLRRLATLLVVFEAFGFVDFATFPLGSLLTLFSASTGATLSLFLFTAIFHYLGNFMILFQRIPPYVLSFESHINNGFPTMWSTGT